MIILVIFAFLAGIITILSPCILPILPVILASSMPGSTRRPYGIITGFILSFTFFTLFLSSLVRVIGVTPEALRTLSVIVIGGLGLSLLIPRFQQLLESLFSRLANWLPNTSSRTGFGGGVVVGLSIGLLWTPCVGPILASVIALAATGQVTSDAVVITLAYSLGTAIPMLLIIWGGQQLLARVPWLLHHTNQIQKAFGVVMILTALTIYNGWDRTFQSYVLTKFPGYGAGLTQFEDKAVLRNKLEDLKHAAPDFIVGGEWIGSNPLSLGQLRGKVVLVDFWTYTCINCQRTLPYVKSWDEKYRDQGLVIVGVHSPEFEFEKNVKNVRQAVTDFGIKYPVMQDNDFATWKAYHNNYWPAKYLIDKDGNIRYTHFGEGDYDKTELAIQDLLRETGAAITTTPNNAVQNTFARTPETYLGSLRSNNESYITYSGKWNQSEEYNAPSAGSLLQLNFDAKSVYLVMRNSGTPAIIKIYLDGVYQKEITVDKDMLYTVLDMDSPGRHTLKLEFVDDNAELFAFTFG